MPEFFVKCSTCEGKPLIPIPTSPWSPTDIPNITCPNPLCDRGFVRYGTEPGHEHEWTVDAIKTGPGKYDWQADSVKPRLIECACGKNPDMA